MVLKKVSPIVKYLVLFFGLLLMFSQNVEANNKDRAIFNQAKKSFTAGKYETAIMILRRRYDFRDASTPYGALTLAAISYEKMGNLKNSQHIYTFLIKRRFKTINNEIISAYKASGGADDLPEAPEKLYGYYFQRSMPAMEGICLPKERSSTAIRPLFMQRF